MAKILIVYTTSLGNTLKMARAVADGARSVTEVDLKKEPFKAVYCADPWSNLIEIYSHDTVLIYANR